MNRSEQGSQRAAAEKLGVAFDTPRSALGAGGAIRGPRCAAVAGRSSGVCAVP